MLAPFNLVISDEEEVLVKRPERPSTPMSGASSPAPEMPPPKAISRERPKPTGKNAFDELMRGAKGGKSSSSSSSTSKPSTSARSTSSTSTSKAGSSSRPIELDEFGDDNDDLLNNLSARDLDLLEKRAQIAVTTGKPVLGSSSSSSSRPKVPVPPRPASKLNINVVPKAFQTGGKSGFKTSIMKDLRQQHTHAVVERNRSQLGGVVTKLPGASSAGTGLGAYQPARPKTITKVDSGSSASESSDEDDRGGLSQLIKKQKSPLKPTKTVKMPRSIQVMGDPGLDALRKREDERARKARMKMRLKPDLNPLYQHVLGWNPSHTGPDVPHSDYARRILSAPGLVPASFPSAQRYEQVMLPLYLQELWMQALKDENRDLPLAIEVTLRNYEDAFIDLEVAVAGQIPERFSLNESDVVVLQQGGNPNKVFAKVQGYRRRFKDVGIKLRILQSMDQKELGGKNKWMLRKHLS